MTVLLWALYKMAKTRPEKTMQQFRKKEAFQVLVYIKFS